MNYGYHRVIIVRFYFIFTAQSPLNILKCYIAWNVLFTLRALIGYLEVTCHLIMKLFLVVLPWFLNLGEIQDGDHFWWRHRPPAAPPLIKYTLSCRGDQRLSHEGKIVSEYSKILQNIKTCRGLISHPPPPHPPCTTLVGLCTRVPPRVNIKVFVSRTIFRWWDTTRPAPGLSWSTGATKATTQRQSKPEQTPSVS